MIYIVEIDCICLFALIFVAKSMRKKRNLGSASNYFYLSCYFTMLVITMDIFSLLLESGTLGFLSNSIAFNYLINIIYYVAAACATYYWFMNTGYVINSTFWGRKRNMFLAMIPVFFSVVLSLLSIWKGYYFYIDEANKYHRGSLFFVNNVICYVYAFLSCIIALRAALRETDYIKRKQYLLISFYIVFPLLVAVIQVLRPDIPTIHVGMTVPIIYIYTELLDLQISTDYLTGLNNRNQLMRFLNMAVANPTKDKTLFLFLIDVDSFKKINDSYGHAEGDFALQKTAEVLKSVAKKFGGFVARYGGDEFNYVVELDDEQTVEDIKKYFEKQCKSASKDLKYKLSLSVGCAKHTPSLKVNELFLLADSDMYKEKSVRKKLLGV